MPRDYKRKTPKLSSADCDEAVEAVKNKAMTLKEAAKRFGITTATISRHLKNPHSKLGQGRFTNVFSPQQEEEICVHAINLSIRYYGVSRLALAQLAFQLAEENKIPHTFNKTKRMAGYDWVVKFLDRNKTRVSIRTASALSLQRVFGFRKQCVDTFFNNLEETFVQYPMLRDSRNIYNMDETGLSIVTKTVKVIAQKGAKHVHSVVALERGRLITLLCALHAAGTDIIPAFFVFPKNSPSEEKLSLGPANSTATTSSNGWSTSKIFVVWLQHFVFYSRASSTNPKLLILDGHVSHTSLEAIEFCNANGVTMVTLPPHTSHKLQPLDVGFFGPFKKRFSHSMHTWMGQHKYSRPEEHDIPAIIKDAFEKTNTKAASINSFSKTGIWDAELNSTNRHVFHENEYVVDDDDENHVHPNENDQAEGERTNNAQLSENTVSSPDNPDQTEDSTNFSVEFGLAEDNSFETDYNDLNDFTENDTVEKSQHAMVFPTTMFGVSPDDINPIPAKPKIKATSRQQKSQIITSPEYRADLAIKEEKKQNLIRARLTRQNKKTIKNTKKKVLPFKPRKPKSQKPGSSKT